MMALINILYEMQNFGKAREMLRQMSRRYSQVLRAGTTESAQGVSSEPISDKTTDLLEAEGSKSIVFEVTNVALQKQVELS